MTIPNNFGEGHANLAPDGAQGEPTLVKVLQGLNGQNANNPIDWQIGIAVLTHVVTLAKSGFVLVVEATAASSTGAKGQIQSGSPAVGEVDVAYDAEGVPTLTFNATDAVTECAVTQLVIGKDLLA